MRSRAAAFSRAFMISLSRISKQYGRQLVFVDASFQLNPGERAGLVGPNGAGKTTLFRMIVGEESADDGDVSVPKKMTIGYFRQDIEEMSGRSVLDEAIAGSGRLGDLHHELEALQNAMSDPDRINEMDAILDRFGHVQEDYAHLGGYELEARARGAGRTRLRRRSHRRRRWRIERRMEDARSHGQGPPRAPGRAADGRADQPPRHRVDHLARRLSQALRRLPADDVARPRVHEPRRHEDRGDR